MSNLLTIPGTETKVMPESEDPIIPNATTYHGDFLLPRKNASSSECFLPVIHEIVNRALKYSIINIKIIFPFIEVAKVNL
jgi:hypothetical protein